MVSNSNMEEENAQLSTETINSINDVEYGGEDEEFYEKIEAPKFVDFTLPDPYRPDDRYWFCLRVGCDQKHEEEMDSEEIYKNFVLRVMAARSPNVRLRKALNGKQSSMNIKCPLSAPPKSSKSRISRLALISSIPQKIVSDKGKRNSSQKFSSTPKAKGKQVAAKYMTTPRHKKCLPSPSAFRSVQNPKPTTMTVPKNRTVAKALVFHSPKKAIRVKSSVQLSASITKICAGMKRLEITSQRKCVLGYSGKLSKDNGCDPKKSDFMDSSKRQLSVCKDKKKIPFSLSSQNCKDKEAKSLRCIKSKSKVYLNKLSSVPKDIVKNESTNTESDVKLRDCSAADSSRTIEENGHEEHLPTVKISDYSDDTNANKEEASDVPPSRGSSGQLRSDVVRGERNSLPNPEEKGMEGNELSISQAMNGKRCDKIEGIESEDDIKSNIEDGGRHKDGESDYQTLEGARDECEVMDSDDKENDLAYEENRDFEETNNRKGRKLLREAHEKIKKVAQALDKNLNGDLTSGTISTPSVKYKKTKPTNPKPFRLRTDERGILREANQDRKIHFLAPSNERTTESKFPVANLRGRCGNDVQRTEKCIRQNKYKKGTLEDGEKDTENNEPKQNKAAETISTGQVRPRKVTTPPVHSKSRNQGLKSITYKPEYGKSNARQKSENSLTKMRSPSVQQLVKRQGTKNDGNFCTTPSGRKAVASKMTCGHQPTAIKETSLKSSRHKEARKPVKYCDYAEKKATYKAASRNLSQEKRPVTVPKEPKFHVTHPPNSCITKVA